MTPRPDPRRGARPTSRRPAPARVPLEATASAPTWWTIAYKPIGMGLLLVHALVAFAVVRLIWSDPVPYAYGLVAVLVAPLVYVEMELFARSRGWEHGPIFDFRQRITWITVVGYALALALVTALTVGETRGRAREEQARAERDAAYAEQERLRKSPEVLRAQQALQALQERAAKIAATRPK